MYGHAGKHADTSTRVDTPAAVPLAATGRSLYQEYPAAVPASKAAISGSSPGDVHIQREDLGSEANARGGNALDYIAEEATPVRLADDLMMHFERDGPQASVQELHSWKADSKHGGIFVPDEAAARELSTETMQRDMPPDKEATGQRLLEAWPVDSLEETPIPLPAACVASSNLQAQQAGCTGITTASAETEHNTYATLEQGLIPPALSSVSPAHALPLDAGIPGFPTPSMGSDAATLPSEEDVWQQAEQAMLPALVGQSSDQSAKPSGHCSSFHPTAAAQSGNANHPRLASGTTAVADAQEPGTHGAVELQADAGLKEPEVIECGMHAKSRPHIRTDAHYGLKEHDTCGQGSEQELAAGQTDNLSAMEAAQQASTEGLGTSGTPCSSGVAEGVSTALLASQHPGDSMQHGTHLPATAASEPTPAQPTLQVWDDVAMLSRSSAAEGESAQAHSAQHAPGAVTSGSPAGVHDEHEKESKLPAQHTTAALCGTLTSQRHICEDYNAAQQFGGSPEACTAQQSKLSVQRESPKAAEGDAANPSEIAMQGAAADTLHAGGFTEPAVATMGRGPSLPHVPQEAIRRSSSARADGPQDGTGGLEHGLTSALHRDYQDPQLVTGSSAGISAHTAPAILGGTSPAATGIGIDCAQGLQAEPPRSSFKVAPQEQPPEVGALQNDFLLAPEPASVVVEDRHFLPVDAGAGTSGLGRSGARGGHIHTLPAETSKQSSGPDPARPSDFAAAHNALDRGNHAGMILAHADLSLAAPQQEYTTAPSSRVVDEAAQQHRPTCPLTAAQHRDGPFAEVPDCASSTKPHREEPSDQMMIKPPGKAHGPATYNLLADATVPNNTTAGLQLPACLAAHRVCAGDGDSETPKNAPVPLKPGFEAADEGCGGNAGQVCS